MRRTALAVAVMLAACPVAARAATADDFLVRTTRDLVDLCSVDNSDPMHVAAIHFCQGFVVGAYQYYQAERAGPGKPALVCYPPSGPTRDEAIRMFVDWARKNPAYMSERPVDSLFRFGASMWPCAK